MMTNSLDQAARAERSRELRSYLIGFALAVLLTAIAFAAVLLGAWSRVAVLWVIAVAAVAQIIVHFRFFLHIDLSKSKSDDLQLILFSFLILAMMVAGTIWILANLHARMM
jgi:cytochrome o ubiquinol oxidase subunit IV